MYFNCFLYIIFCTVLFACANTTEQKNVEQPQPQAPVVATGPPTVEIRETESGYQLFRHGEPFYINGAGGYEHYTLLKALGANAVRIWTEHNALPLLDSAHELGLAVMLGIMTGREHWGMAFDYASEEQVQAKFAEIAETIQKFKDHPALLMWNLGNEITLVESDYVPAWQFINRLAKLVKSIDPNHPVTYSHHGFNAEECRLMALHMPDVDVLSLNVFSDIYKTRTFAPGLTKTGWTKPYIFSEWGSPGYWESESSSWGAPFEMNTSERAAFYHRVYHEVIAVDTTHCLGNFAFYWGEKFEATHTFFSLLPEGRQSGITEALAKCWTKTGLFFQAPLIESFYIDGVDDYKNPVMKAKQTYPAKLAVSNPGKGKLSYRWEIRPEAVAAQTKGDYERVLNIGKNSPEINFQAPAKFGAYRIFVFVTNEQGFIATANMPFYILLD